MQKRTLFIDLETRARVNVKEVGAYRYAADPDFEILMAAYALDDEPVRVAVGRDAIKGIPGLLDPLVVKVAHNAAFERVCLSRFFRFPVGRFLSAAEWEDTAVRGPQYGFPRKLDTLARALGAEAKDTAGGALISYWSMPITTGSRKGEFRRPEDNPEKWAAFQRYCSQDVDTLRDVWRRLPSAWPNGTERDVWLTDQRINDRGIDVDVPMVLAANEAALAGREAEKAELAALTGLENPNSVVQLKGWLDEQGSGLLSLQAETVDRALAGDGLSPAVRRALELRRSLALSSSAKYGAALARLNPDNRLRGEFKFHGAHTGRWSGSGVQLHNLPRAQVQLEGLEQARVDALAASGAPKGEVEAFEAVLLGEAVETAVFDLVSGFGATADTLKRLIRSMFVGPFSVVDYAQIEARVIAWLGGETWALEAFAAGRDIYVETAERMSSPGRTYSRKDGKVATLALGYGSGERGLREMGASGSSEELVGVRDAWRAANPAIVSFWYELEEAFYLGAGRVGGPLGSVSVEKDGSTRMVRLPSGRALHYRDCRVRHETDSYGRRRRKLTFADPAKWPARAYTWGGTLAENVTQAVARDVLAEALVRLQRAGVAVVGHVHDEVLARGDVLERMRAEMLVPPSWASGLPIAAEGFVSERYRKG